MWLFVVYRYAFFIKWTWFLIYVIFRRETLKTTYVNRYNVKNSEVFKRNTALKIFFPLHTFYI